MTEKAREDDGYRDASAKMQILRSKCMRDPDLLHPVVGDDVLVRGAGGLEGVQRVHRPHVLPQRLKVTLDRGGNLYKKMLP